MCFPAHVGWQNMLQIQHGSLFGDPNQAELYIKYPGQMESPVWLYRLAKPLAGIPAHVMLRGEIWSVQIQVLVAAPLLCPHVISSIKSPRFSLRSPWGVTYVDLPESDLQYWGIRVYTLGSMSSLEKLHAPWAHLVCPYAVLGKVQRGQRIAIPLFF